jgi:hypothetical protein
MKPVIESDDDEVEHGFVFFLLAFFDSGNVEAGEVEDPLT